MQVTSLRIQLHRSLCPNFGPHRAPHIHCVMPHRSMTTFCQHDAGAPRADWSAPSHGKQQPHSPLSRTPARAPRKPHPMAVAAARRAQKTPAKAGLPDAGVGTPAKHMLSSSAMRSHSTPTKYLCTPNEQFQLGRSPVGGLPQQWHRQTDVSADDVDLGMEVCLDAPGRRVPFRSQLMGSSTLHAPRFQPAHQQAFRPETLGCPSSLNAGGIKSGKQNMFGRVGSQQPVNAAFGTAQQALGGGGSSGGLQLRTPSRPNSAGSALRGYVPPEHRYLLKPLTNYECVHALAG